ncbi:MAG: IS481 family transposase [Sumerlaeia bacterium]
MPWKETSPKMEKVQFIAAWRTNQDSMAELCRQFGISRKTGYKIVARWRAEEEGAFTEHSRAPKSCPWATKAPVREAILALRRKHPTWGPKKLRARLAQDHPGERWPALSTIGELLRREGLTEEQRRRRRACPRRAEAAQAPGEKWCADFKGHFRTQNNTRCDPLTVTDDFSRLLLGCRALSPPIATEDVIAIFIELFREYGLPEVIQTDNGPPFGAAGGLGLTRLSAFWIRLGISPRRIEPGKPQQNGRHERMHRTLKAETIRPVPAASLAGQQRRFDAFREVYNRERPHEGLGLVTPISLFTPSPRAYPETVRAPEYDEGAIVRRVSKVGSLRWRKEHYFFTTTLAGEDVRLVEHEEEPILSVIYYRELIGRIDLGSRRVCGPDPGGLPAGVEFIASGPKRDSEAAGHKPMENESGEPSQ